MKLPRLAVVCIAALTLTACGVLDEGDGGGNEADEGGITVRVGYLHTIGVDDKLQLGLEKGNFAANGIDLDITQFDTGVAVSQALVGGSIDVAIMGGVTSNFPAQGQGKIFLANSVETDTGQIWANPESGIESVADLKGKTLITTEGTTADILLLRALDDAGMNRTDVNVVNAGMSNAVQAFVSGSADAIALWVPFDLRVLEGLPEAVLVDSAKNYPDAAVTAGWIANNEWYEENEEAMRGIIRGWLDTNEEFRTDPDGALATVHEVAYSDEAELEDLQHQIGFQTDYTNEEWLKHYQSGAVLEWVGAAEEAFVELGGVPEFVEPSEFFDTSLFIETAEEYLGE